MDDKNIHKTNPFSGKAPVSFEDNPPEKFNQNSIPKITGDTQIEVVDTNPFVEKEDVSAKENENAVNFETKELKPPTWSLSAKLGIKVLAGLGAVAGALLAIGLFPLTIAGLFILLSSDPKKDHPKLGVVLAFPLMGAIKCLKVITEC